MPGSQSSVVVEETAHGASEIVKGDDALVSAADLVFQAMRSDSRLEGPFGTVDLPTLAAQLRTFLSNAFSGEWPEIRPSDAISTERCAELIGAMLEVMAEPLPLGEDPMVCAMEAVNTKLSGDSRVVAFFDHIRAAAAAAAAETGAVKEEDAGDEELEEEGEEAGEEEGEVAEAEEVEEQDAVQESKANTSGADVDVHNFDLLNVAPADIAASQLVWKTFINSAASPEAAGEAIYAALFEGAPSLQSLFITPRAVQSIKFMNGLAGFIMALDDPEKLKVLVQTLGFGHLHLDVTVPRVVIFRDAILDLFAVELAERYTPEAARAWKALLNYVGGALIYIKVNYAERIRTLLASWEIANKGSDENGSNAGDGHDPAKVAAAKTTTETKKKGWGFMDAMTSKTTSNTSSDGAAGEEKSDGKGKGQKNGAQNVPTTYPEMFQFNMAVMGFGDRRWLQEVLDCFNNIVANVANSARLQEECDVLTLRIAKHAKGNVNFAEYKSCMMASLRALLPKDWSTAHEVAWTWLWENVERLLMINFGKPPKWEVALAKILASLDESTKFEFRKDIYATFFTLAPVGQDYFKQSNTYLHWIADKILDMCLEIYRDPVKMVDDISALGLRHVGYAIPTDLFSPFITACVNVLLKTTQDPTTVDSFRWSLSLVGKMLVRTIIEGSTIVMKAINANSRKRIKLAVDCAPRGERAQWMLLVQVGTQNISPLNWAIESGALEGAEAMIKDLLTIRADRDRYYYGMNELFSRHTDIIKKLTENAPTLLPVLFDGLIWRSRLNQDGLRRVNYYIKPLLLTQDGKFAATVKNLCDFADPGLVCHPIIAYLSDTIWSGVAMLAFIKGKAFFIIIFMIFIISQSLLESVMIFEHDIQRGVIFGLRCIIYGLSMTTHVHRHAGSIFKAYRKKDTIKIKSVSIPAYLSDWQESASLLLTLSLVLMLAMEPILWCWGIDIEIYGMFEDGCDRVSTIGTVYTKCSMVAMFLYYSLLIDLVVFSNRVSAFVLVCGRMLGEVGLFLLALVGAIVTTASSASVLHHTMHDLRSIQDGALTLLEMSLGMYGGLKYEQYHDEPVLFVTIALFLITVVIFFLNLLIAQLVCAYERIYSHMVGLARISRMEIIVETIQTVSTKRWDRFVETLQLDANLEFNEGDIGFPGGVQMREPSTLNPTTIDTIRRFGGSTAKDVPWPADEEMDGESGSIDNRYDRVEDLIARAVKRIAQKEDEGGGSKGIKGSGSGTGGEGSGTGGEGGGDGSDGGGSDDGEAED